MERLFSLTILLAQTCYVGSGRREYAPNAGTVALTHISIIDTATLRASHDMTVVIVGGRIADIGNSRKVNVPKAAQVIEAAGKFLIPGMWDMHVHTFSHNPPSAHDWYFPLLIANGVTGVRDMWTTSERE